MKERLSKIKDEGLVERIPVSHAKVYLKQSDIRSSPKKGTTFPIRRYVCTVNVLSIMGNPTASCEILLFIVKGNPLMVSNAPLPCFFTGNKALSFEFRLGEDISEWSLQVVLPEMSSHFAIPVDELVENDNLTNRLERSITLWDCQTGVMRGSCAVEVECKFESPLSVSEILESRKRAFKHEGEDEQPLNEVSKPEVVPATFAIDSRTASVLEDDANQALDSVPVVVSQVVIPEAPRRRRKASTNNS